MGTDPTAAARCKGSWLRLSLTLAVALCRISLRAVLRFALEAVKWRAVFGMPRWSEMLAFVGGWLIGTGWSSSLLLKEDERERAKRKK